MSDNRSAQHLNTRLGLRLFAGYSLFYLAFVLVNAFAPQLAEWKPAGGINLATWWGLGLIGLAFLLALIYGRMCRPDDQHSTGSSSPVLGEASENE